MGLATSNDQLSEVEKFIKQRILALLTAGHSKEAIAFALGITVARLDWYLSR